MFKKNESEPMKPAPPAPSGMSSAPSAPRATVSTGRPAAGTAPSVIGPDLTIMGNLSSKGQVQIDGEVQGDINGTHIIVGERANITGGIAAEEVVVRGHVMGSIRGKRVMLQSQSHVEGDIYHQALAIEQGAYFEGKSRRSDDPLSGVTPSEAPPMASSQTSSSGA